MDRTSRFSASIIMRVIFLYGWKTNKWTCERLEFCVCVCVWMVFMNHWIHCPCVGSYLLLLLTAYRIRPISMFNFSKRNQRMICGCKFPSGPIIILTTITWTLWDLWYRCQTLFVPIKYNISYYNFLLMSTLNFIFQFYRFTTTNYEPFSKQ